MEPVYMAAHAFLGLKGVINHSLESDVEVVVAL